MSAYRLSFRRALTFANASLRYAINPVTGAVTGPYAASIPAIVTVGGERYLQAERAVQNSALYSNNFTQYTTNTGLTISGDQNQVGPIGGAASLLLETTDNSLHRLYTTYSHTGTFTWSICVKKYGSANRWVRLQGVTGNISRFNLQTNAWDTLAAANSNHFVVALGNGWYRIGLTCVPAGESYFSAGLSDSAINDNYTGSTSVGLYVWQRTIQPVSYATSITTTVASAVTRAKDEGYIPAASVPTALKDKGTQSFRPAWSSDQVTTGDLRYLAEFADSSQNIKIYYNGTDKKIYVYGASALVASDATTHSANQKLTVAYDRAAGSITLSGFTTGNGTYTGTAWDRTDGNLYVGMDASLANQIDGCISELGILS